MKSAVLAASFAALAAALPQDGYGYITRVTTKVTPTIRTTTTCDITICADYINSCSMAYGGCYPACPGLPTPTFTPPPCPTTTKPTKTTSKKPCQTICVDAVNECGIRYGGCYCSEEPFPYPKPPCPSTTIKTSKRTTPSYPTPTSSGPRRCGGLLPNGPKCNKNEICIDDPKSPCGIAADCPGICVVEQFCGGFAGFPCPNKGDVCIDDPRDDCDPKNGGADCGGLCVPKKWT